MEITNYKPKKKLENTKIFGKVIKQESYMTNTVEENIDTCYPAEEGKLIPEDPIPQPVKSFSPVCIPSISQERVENPLNDLVVNTIKKIKKTPYWTDYSDSEQEKMISRYFDIKIKAEKYSDIKIGLKEKCAFIQDVMERAQKI